MFSFLACKQYMRRNDYKQFKKLQETFSYSAELMYELGVHKLSFDVPLRLKKVHKPGLWPCLLI